MQKMGRVQWSRALATTHSDLLEYLEYLEYLEHLEHLEHLEYLTYLDYLYYLQYRYYLQTSWSISLQKMGSAVVQGVSHHSFRPPGVPGVPADLLEHKLAEDGEGAVV